MKYHKSAADLRLDKLQAKKILNEIRANRSKSCAPIDSRNLKGCVAYFQQTDIEYAEAVEDDCEAWAAHKRFLDSHLKIIHC